VLVTGKAEMRRKRQEFFAEEKLKLVQSMNHVVERFHAEITARCEALDQQRIEAIRDREEQRLLRAVDQFHAMLDDLTAGFESIIHEGVSARP
jgi:predicted HAD superfamily Cof-like phosphohydrolase